MKRSQKENDRCRKGLRQRSTVHTFGTNPVLPTQDRKMLSQL